MKLFHRKSGQGRPLIILHGLFGTSDNWAALAKLWSQHFTVYAVDVRNHGQSPHSEEWSYSTMAEDIIELMGDEKLHNATLLGHSMGGKVGMRLAIDYPTALSKLVVVDIAPRQSLPNNNEVIQALQRVDLDKINSRKDAEAVLRPFLQDEGTIQFLLKNLFWKENSGGEKRLAWRSNLDVIAEKINEVYTSTIPDSTCETETLFIRGGESQYITPENEAQIRTHFPKSEILTVEGAGHWVHADQPEEVYRHVLDFCK